MDDDRLATSTRPGPRSRTRIRAALAIAFLLVGILAPTAVVQAATDQTITFDLSGLPAKTYGDVPFAITAAATSGLPVTFSTDTTTVCTVVTGSTNAGVTDGTVTIAGAGLCTIHADQAGDGVDWNPAVRVDQSFTAAKATLIVTADPETKTFGSSDPAFTFAYGAFVGTDDSTVVDTPPTCSAADPHVEVAGSPYAITCSGGLDNNYTFSYIDGELTITKATPGISVAGGSFAFDGSPHAGSGFAYGVGGTGDVLTPAVTLSYAGTGGTTYGPSSTAPSLVGTYSMTADFAGNSNYASDSAGTTLTIAAAAQTITFDLSGLPAKTYGDVPFAITAAATSGLPVTFSTDTTTVCTVVTGSTNAGVTDGTVTIAGAGLCTIHADQAGDTNWSPATRDDQAFAVATATLTVTGITASNRQWDGATTATLDASGATLVGVVAGDIGNVTLDVSGAVGTFTPDASVGNGKTVLISGLTLAGPAKDNYTLTQPMTTADITKATPGISVAGGSFAFDGSPHAGSGFAYGVGGTGDVLTPAVTLSYAGTGGTTYGPSSTAPSLVGTYSMTADFAGNSNYASDSAGTTLTIAAAAQTITFDLSGLPAKTYGDVPFAITAAATSGLPVTFSTDTTTVCTVVTGSTNAGVTDGTVTIAGAGLCTIHADQAGEATTYAAAPTVAHTFAVAKTMLTVTVQPASKTYGGPNPSFAVAYAGFVSPDGAGNLGGSLAYSTAATPSSPAGPYSVGASGLASANYGFTYVAGTLTIGKATPTLNLAASVATFETKVPVAFTASLPAAGSGAPPTGSVTFTVTGFADQAVPLSTGGASLARTFTTIGVKSAVATFTGDANYAPAQRTLPFTVVLNTVNATGVGLSASAVYPIRDGWKDTVAIRGTRNESMAVAIRIYNSSGRLVRTVTYGRSGGAYSWAWNGRTAGGSLLAAGKYRVDQTLTDAYGASRLFRSYVTVSLRTMHWRSAAIYAVPGPRHWQYSWGYPSSTISAASSSTSSALTMASSWLPSLGRYDWIGVGYQFTLPSASTYRSLSFQVMGRWSGSTAPKLGLNDWTVRGAFDGRTFGGGAFNFVRPRSNLGTSATTWYGQYQTNMARFASGRTVRAFIDTGGYLGAPVRYTITRVRLVVSYGLLY